MKLLFKNTTTYSKHIYDDFLNFHSKKFALKYHIVSFAISMLIIFLIEEVTQEYHSNKITQKQSFTFCFYKNYFKIYTKKEYSIVHYRKIYKIFETDTFFYIYLDRRHSLLMDKSGFKKGTPLAFRTFIKKKCPFKYKLDKTK